MLHGAISAEELAIDPRQILNRLAFTTFAVVLGLLHSLLLLGLLVRLNDSSDQSFLPFVEATLNTTDRTSNRVELVSGHKDALSAHLMATCLQLDGLVVVVE